MRRVRKLPARRQITRATGVDPEGDHNFANYFANNKTFGDGVENNNKYTDVN
jgi:hypothetical protein